MILHSEDYQFQQSVSFVRLDEYYNEPGGQLRGKFRHQQAPRHKQSFLHFNENGQLLSCRTEQSEEVHCYYQDELLVKRIFKVPNSDVYCEENRIYNEQRLLCEKNLLDNNSLNNRVRYKYNEELKLIREEYLKNSKRYFYNDIGLCIEEHLYTENEHVKSLFYRYDDNGNISELLEENPVGTSFQINKYYYNQFQLISNYQLINQDGLVLTNLEYKYNNFIENDWLERYTWRLSGRSGKLSRHATHTCLRSPCLERDSNQELYFCRDFKTVNLSEGTYHGRTRMGMMHGQGRLDFFDGSCYIGHFDTGCMDGYGSFYWPDGRIYQGYFESNRMQGLGNYYLADGSLYRGTFAEGQLLSSKPYCYLAGTSPLSMQNRRAAQTANRQGKNQVSEQKFIEAATKAVQQKLQEQVVAREWQVLAGQESMISVKKLETKQLLQRQIESVPFVKSIEKTSKTEKPQDHTLKLFKEEQGTKNFTENFAEDFTEPLAKNLIVNFREFSEQDYRDLLLAKQMQSQIQKELYSLDEARPLDYPRSESEGHTPESKQQNR